MPLSNSKNPIGNLHIFQLKNSDSGFAQLDM